MVRKLSLAIAVALGVTSIGVNALGLGKINSSSALNQYFDAEIELLSLDKEDIADIKVRLASIQAFRQAGVERPFFLSGLNFKPLLLPDGRAVVRVTSKEPIREPFLNFLIELNWPRGRMQREYTVLLDPPVMFDQAPVQVQQPTAASTAPRRSQPAAVVQSGGTESAVVGDEYGPTKRNDTLWRIASQIRQRGTTIEQTMMALFRANPQAFINNNINNLRVGQILRIPRREDALAMEARQARSAFRNQLNDWRAARSAPAAASGVAEPVVAPSVVEEEPAPPPEVTSQPELKIATRKSDEADEAGEAGAQSQDQEQVAEASLEQLQTELTAAREARESAVAEGEALQARIQNLEAQLDDLQRLVSLKDDQLAQLQSALQDEAAAGGDAEAVQSLPQAEVPAEAETEELLVESQAEEVVADAEAEQMAAVDQLQAQTDLTQPAVDRPEALLQEMAAEGGDAGESVLDSGEEIETLTGDAAEEQVLSEMDTAEEMEITTPADDLTAADDQSEPAMGASPLQHLWQQFVSNTTLLMGIVGAALLVLLSYLWIAISSRNKMRREEFQESILVDTIDAQDAETTQATTEIPAQGSEETSFLSDFSPSDVGALQEETGEVDPLAEADVYIAYGRYRQAESLVRQALDRNPERLELKQKLFEILYATNDAEGFTRLAEEAAADEMEQRDPSGWEKVVAMGAKLAPAAAVFSAVNRPMSAADDKGIAELQDELGQIGDLDLTTTTQAEAQPDSAKTDEFDLGALEDLPDLDLDLDTVEAKSAGGLDFDLDLGDQEKTDTTLGGLKENLEGSSDEDASSSHGETLELDELEDLEFSLDSTDGFSDTQVNKPAEPELSPVAEVETLELPDTQSGAEQPESNVFDLHGALAPDADEVNTKLDLARAYVDMGDSDGARDILKEVIDEGTDGQKAEAQRMLETMAG